MEIPSDAPAVATAGTEVAASPETVWEVLTSVRDWPDWNPDVSWIVLEGEVAEGSVFRWKAGPGTITSTFRRLDPPRVVAWTGRSLGIRATHVWRLRPGDGGTHVETEEAFEGLMVRLLRGPMQRTLERALETGLAALKEEAERRTSS